MGSSASAIRVGEGSVVAGDMARDPNRPVVRAESLSLTFSAKDKPVQALDNVSLTIGEGEFVTLIGPSGCGKTTLLRIIADLEAPSSGRIEVDGMSADQARRNRAYGFVFQAPALYPWRTVLGNVSLPLEIMDVPRAERRERALVTLSTVELYGFDKKFPWQLSGGMQQRASIARALSFKPRILLMDEPFGALDEITRDNLNAHLKDLWRNTDLTVVFVTQSIPEAVFLSTRIVVMSPRPGRILEEIESDLPSEASIDIRESPEFLAIAQRVRAALRHSHS